MTSTIEKYHSSFSSSHAYDESNVEDIDTRQEDHIYDECRYVLMENPISPPRHTSAPPVLDDPLELHRKAKFLRV